MKHWWRALLSYACPEVIDWAKTQSDAETAWQNCNRGDWMLWLLGYYAGVEGSDSRRKLVLCCCDVASLSRRYTKGAVRTAFDRCQRATRSWARGRGATLDDVRAAGEAAWEAGLEAAEFEGHAHAARRAANVATNRMDAYVAAYASDCAITACCSELDIASWDRSQALRARIVRRHYPHPPALGKKVRFKPPKRREISGFSPSRSG